jgi:hypothetical protein
MADVTISSLPLGTPSGDALLPYSQGGNTLATSVSAILQNTSRVGIGTTAPDAPLCFAGTVGEKISLYGTNNNYRFGLGVQRLGVTTSFNTILYGPNYSNAGVQIGTIDQNDGTTFNPTLNILGTGNVGIGTTTPTAKLDVNGDVKATNTAKAYAIFDGNNAINTECTVLKSYNISKIEKLGNVGEYKIAFASSVSWPYVPVTGGFNNGTGNGGWNSIAYLQTTYGYPEPSNTGFNIHSFTSSGGWQSQRYVSFAVF